jgi:ketosteroid isomerase-like protein
MPQHPGDNIAVVRESFEAWNENDWERLARAYDPEVIVDPPEVWPEGETSRGWEALRIEFERLKDSWEQERVEVHNVSEIGERVLAEMDWIAQGKASGVSVTTPMWAVFALRDSRIVRLKYFQSRESALEAASEPVQRP